MVRGDVFRINQHDFNEINYVIIYIRGIKNTSLQLLKIVRLNNNTSIYLFIFYKVI